MVGWLNEGVERTPNSLLVSPHTAHPREGGSPVRHELLAVVLVLVDMVCLRLEHGPSGHRFAGERQVVSGRGAARGERSSSSRSGSSSRSRGRERGKDRGRRWSDSPSWRRGGGGRDSGSGGSSEDALIKVRKGLVVG